MEGKGDSLRILPHIHKIGLVFLLALAVVLPSVARMGEAAAAESDIQAEAAILIDADPGRVLWSKNGAERHYPASMTKMMGLLLIFEALHDKKISWDESVSASEYAASMGGSQVFLEAKLTFCDAMEDLALVISM